MGDDDSRSPRPGIGPPAGPPARARTTRRPPWAATRSEETAIGAPAARCDPAPAVALVLAGRRPEGDPLAAAHGVSHKALLPLAGRSMLGHVLRAVHGAGLSRIAVCTDAPETLAADPDVAALRRRGLLELWPADASPAASVAAALRRAAPSPLLVTTADHPLLGARPLAWFRRKAAALDADAVVGVVDEATAAAGPASRRTWIRLRDGRVTGANLFWLRPPGAVRAAAFWRRAERSRKRPWRLAALFGPLALARFAAGRLDLAEATDRASAAMGARVTAVRLPFPECALDVDGPEDLAVAARWLGEGGGATCPTR